MYTDWFQLDDRPFSITPDPRFLYLSEPHREALAHLLYGVTEGGGFIQLTGEVGTGKTTLTRTLLEQLPEHVDAALVYNAHDSLTEFLETICDELGVTRQTGVASPKQLTDALNRYLLDAHAKGRRTVLIVDEAQNLNAELLEQVRLLTNLETHREKLLQILLIGQPELRDTLARSELRQLAQRVTARYHLEPLDEAATAAYVRHRLEVAGARRPLFTPAAMRALHRASGGIPRLINVLGDRALLGAFADGAAQVDAALVKRAAREVGGTPPARSRYGWAAVAVVLVAAAAVGLVFVTRERTMEPATPAVASVASVASVAAVEPEPEPVEPEPAPEAEPPDLTGLFEADDDLAGATATLLQLWGATGGDGLPGRLCGIATEQGLSCVRGRGSWNNLRVLDRPALLELRADGATRTVLVTGMDGANARLWLPYGEVAVPVLTLDPAWLGEYLLLWQPPETPAPTLRRDMRSPAVVWLRDALQQWAGTPIAASPDPQRFDAALESAVREFQQSLGLEVDGIAGERTMVHLDGITGTSGPRLHRLEDADVPDS